MNAERNSMSEQNQNDQRRQERAKLVSAFSQRAWQPSEQPRPGKILAGAVALVLVAGGALGLGAMNSYRHKKSAEDQARARQVALSTHGGPPSSIAAPSPSPVPVTPTASPARRAKSAHQNPVEAESGRNAPARPKDAAATAVKRLAVGNPGRHICYRAYVVGIGWQHPVCDGSTAGTTSRPIKSLNIAVSGVGGTSAAGLIQERGWEKGAWKKAANGIDLYIGNKRNAHNMQGFGINVGEGSVCQNTYISKQGWQGLGCDKPGSYIFGGTLSKTHWLEAVQLTV
jgi:hypothetical protein